jgi:SAM-dependent methyltransferase
VTETTTDDTAFRAQLHGMWSAVAPAWGEHADYADQRGVELTQRLLERAGIAAGQHVLELACGPGGAGLAAAALVGDTGEVVLSDVAPEMVAVAAARAKALGLRNVRTLVLDLEAIDQPDETFDAVVCREGFMFAVDPERAARELRRVLRPGGRAAIAVWGPREQNPWLGLVFDSVSAQLGMEIPPPGVPGPFARSDAAELRTILDDAGFDDVAVEDIAAPVRGVGFDEWWERTRALAGPLASMLAAMPPETDAALTARLREAVRPYETPAGLDLPGLSLLASGRR